MCRHLAYLGEPRPISDLVLDAPHSLLKQSYAPRLQKHGVVNADGFGVGWHVPGRPDAVRYRQARPIWGDPSFASLAPTVSASSLVAAVRSATDGFALDESAAAPFQHGRWLWSHNGRFFDWPRARKELWDRVLDVPEAGASVDSALAFGLCVSAWSAGATLGEGLRSAVEQVVGCGGGRLNFLAADGESIAATAYGEDLFWLRDERGTIIASEPLDAGDWQAVPDEHLVVATHAGVSVTPLAASTSAPLSAPPSAPTTGQR